MLQGSVHLDEGLRITSGIVSKLAFAFMWELLHIGDSDMLAFAVKIPTTT
jgi:hypothetical protein